MDTIIVIVIVAIAAWYTGRRIFRQLKGSNSCNCEGGCANCDKAFIEPNCSPPDDQNGE